MLKETLKNVVKMASYAAATWLVIVAAIKELGQYCRDGERGACAYGQRRPARPCLPRSRHLFYNHRPADCPPRVPPPDADEPPRADSAKSRSARASRASSRSASSSMRKMAQQARGLDRVAGADLLATNPDHYAVALHYDAERMNAPVIRARGRNVFAQLMKRKARLLQRTDFRQSPARSGPLSPTRSRSADRPRQLSRRCRALYSPSRAASRAGRSEGDQP